ncbi:MAG: STAS/SEC14 domain-containing protein [Pyrinomonadaceae bacterium]|nr:STAS/SEC14 domain-containing protein [Pyrinomonadaceae bacterium]
MPTIQIDTEQLLNVALQMPREELERFVARLFTLKARQETPGLSERETELLLHINEGLPSATQARLNELIDKRRSEFIDAKELRELKKLTDQIEKSDAKRLALLIELAHLRNVPLRKLIKQLGLKPVSHD